MSNRYAGYCIDCRAEVPAGHGDLKKQGNRWVVSCGGKHAKISGAGFHAPLPKQNPRAKVKPGTFLNGPVIDQPQMTRLSDDAAAKILAEIGSQFVRPLPAGQPTLGIGYDIEIGGKKLSIGTCGHWVGLATDWGTADGKYGLGESQRVHEPLEHAVSLIDGTVLESAKWREGKGIDYWTRQLGAPVKREMGGKNSVSVGELRHTKSGWHIVISVDKPYYLSAQDAEDFDMFDRGGGWGTPFEMREITEPVKEREKREAKEREQSEKAEALIAAFHAVQAKAIELLPLGIRPLTSEEYGRMDEAIYKQQAEVVAENVEFDRIKAEKRVVQLLAEAFPGQMYERLPVMPGNDGGYLGWYRLHRIGDRIVIRHWTGSSSALQGIGVVLPDDAVLIADQQNRAAIHGYRFDERLYEIMVQLDKDGRLSKYGKYAWFGGTATPELGPATMGAYSRERNRTAQEMHAELTQRFAELTDQAEALEILAHEDSITEIR